MTGVDGYGGVRALVLGASGFIGRWVARELSRAGAGLVLSVRRGAAGALVLERWGATGEVRADDLAVPGSAEAVVGEVRPQVTFNLAGYGVDRFERDEALAARLNGDLVEELCWAISRHRDDGWTGQHLVHAGSALEFGAVTGDLSDPWHCRPTTLYGRTKLAGSEQVVGAVQRGNLRGLVARLFTVYGPGEHEGRLLPALLEAARTGADVPLSRGLQRRDFTWVEDVARGLLRLGLVPEVVPEGALNLATGRLATVAEFARVTGGVLGIPPERMKFGQLPTRPEEMAHGPVSVARLRGLLGWTPDTSIADGVRLAAAFESELDPR